MTDSQIRYITVEPGAIILIFRGGNKQLTGCLTDKNNIETCQLLPFNTIKFIMQQYALFSDAMQKNMEISLIV